MFYILKNSGVKSNTEYLKENFKKFEIKNQKHFL